MAKKIIGISGSLRTGSFNTALLRAAQKCVPSDFSLEIASIKDIPLYNGDEEEANGVPAAVENLKQKIISCDGLLISTPEYNYGIPGVLKNTLDWLTRPPKDIPRVFAQRKIGLIGASPSRLGTAFAQNAWLSTLRILNTHPYFGNTLFVASAHTLFNAAGNLTDEMTKKLLQDYVKGFCEFIDEK
ncbi:MAG TPA: NAD(P)H-dependent oxidoreductase [Coxiellaceae bacterium]|nr:NAD(P)H-dependent oxidoreductase [Coxiellaceae bacterium]